MKKLFFAVAVLSLCAVSFAETPSTVNDSNQQQTVARPKKAEGSQSAPRSGLQTDTCSFDFASGVNNTFLRYCVTENGNILNVQTPLGHRQILASEGYGFCDILPAVEYFDFSDAGDSSNWNPATVLSHNATRVKIARTTLDGIWTLTQTITQVPATSSIKVNMALKNNTAVTRRVQLMRFADIDANDTLENTLDSTTNNAMIFNSVGRGDAFGLALQNIGTSPFSYLAYIQDTPSAVRPCAPLSRQTFGPLVSTDGSAVVDYIITIPPNSSKTVNVGYRGL